MVQTKARHSADDTRRALVGAARSIFVQNGVAASRIADITATAGVSIGTFYTHFDGKRKVLDAILDELTSDLRTTDPPPGTPPAEQAYWLNRSYLEGFAGDAPLWYAIERAALTDAGVANALARHRRDRVLRVESLVRDSGDQADPAFTALSLVAMTEECAYNWFVYETPPDLDQAALELGDLWCRMIGAAV